MSKINDHYGRVMNEDRRSKRTAPQIDFYHRSDYDLPWSCSIMIGPDEYHGGDGTTQCEALIMASIHWAMHGTTK